ncbi:MAG: hypothetical protein OHK0046_32860 [Anaerolineae bacterium]
MLSNEFMVEVQKLSRADKLRLIQLLAAELAADENAYFVSGTTYDVWSPYDAPQAAEMLMKMLEDEQKPNE